MIFNRAGFSTESVLALIFSRVLSLRLREPKSLPAFWHIARSFRRSLAWRRKIMSRRQVSDESLAHWFSSRPSAQPVDKVALEVGATVSLCNR